MSTNGPFDGLASQYAECRPDYPLEMFEAIIQTELFLAVKRPSE